MSLRIVLSLVEKSYYVQSNRGDMAAKQGQTMAGPEQLEEYPTVDLDWVRDDAQHPSTLTIFDPETPDIASAWITADTDTSRRLDEIR
jgi:hypothetical protein